MVENIALCTLAMWGLSAVAVNPLAKRFFQKALAKNPEFIEACKAEPEDPGTTEKIKKVYNVKFIQADVMVMGIAGFIAGLAGFPLIGLAWKPLAWPGLIAMIASSFFGYQLYGHPRIL